MKPVDADHRRFGRHRRRTGAGLRRARSRAGVGGAARGPAQCAGRRDRGCRPAAAGRARRSTSSGAMPSLTLAARTAARADLSPHSSSTMPVSDLSGAAAALDRDEQLGHDRSQCARAHRTVAGFCRQSGAPSRRHSQCRFDCRVSAAARHGRLLCQQGLCAVVQRGAASRTGAAAASGSPRSARGRCRPNSRRAREWSCPAPPSIFELPPRSRGAKSVTTRLMRGQRVVIAGIGNRIAVALMRFVPNALLLCAPSISAREASAIARLRAPRFASAAGHGRNCAKARSKSPTSCNSRS